MRPLRQSTAVDLPLGPFVDATDGFTAETGLTLTQPDIRLKKNGSNWAQKSAAQTLSHEENGFYEVSLSATDTDTLGQLLLAVNESGARIVSEEFFVMSASAYDALVGSTAFSGLTSFGTQYIAGNFPSTTGAFTNLIRLETSPLATAVNQLPTVEQVFRAARQANPVILASSLSGWTYAVYVELTNDEASGSSPAAMNLPVMLDAANFPFELADVDGEDIRFTELDGTAIPHYRHYHEGADKRAFYTISATPVTPGVRRSILLHFGNASADSESSFDDTFTLPVLNDKTRLLAYFSEGSGTTAGDETGDFDGALIGGCTWYGSSIAKYQTDDTSDTFSTGNAVVVDGGSTSVIRFPSLYTSSFPAELSISIAFQLTGAQSGALFSILSGDTVLEAFCLTDPRIFINGSSTGAPQFGNGAEIHLTDGQEHVLTYTLGPRGLVVFIDKTLYFKDETATVLPASAFANLNIGNRPTGNGLACRIGWVHVEDRQITLNEHIAYCQLREYFPITTCRDRLSEEQVIIAGNGSGIENPGEASPVLRDGLWSVYFSSSFDGVPYTGHYGIYVASGPSLDALSINPVALLGGPDEIGGIPLAARHFMVPGETTDRLYFVDNNGDAGSEARLATCDAGTDDFASNILPDVVLTYSDWTTGIANLFIKPEPNDAITILFDGLDASPGHGWQLGIAEGSGPYRAEITAGPILDILPGPYSVGSSEGGPHLIGKVHGRWWMLNHTCIQNIIPTDVELMSSVDLRNWNRYPYGPIVLRNGVDQTADAASIEGDGKLWILWSRFNNATLTSDIMASFFQGNIEQWLTDSVRVTVLSPLSSAGADGVGSPSAAAVWSYGQRTMTAGPITEVDGQQFNARILVRGNNYGPSGRSFLITKAAGAEWPDDLDDYTWTYVGRKHADNENDGDDDFQSTSVSVITPTGDSQALHPTIPASVTDSLAPGLYETSLRGTFTGGNAWSVELGLVEVKDDPAQS